MREIEIKSIPVELLVIDEDYRAREKNDSDHIKRLSCSAPQDWPPLIVTPMDDGKYLVIDGCHRIAAGAAINNGDDRIFKINAFPCQVVELEDDDGEYDLAVKANLGPRPLPLSIGDRKQYAIWMHQEDSELSMREIGRRVGLAPNTVITAIKNYDFSMAGNGPSPKPKQFPKFLNALVKAGSEGGGLLGFGDRTKYVEKCIMEAKHPQSIIEAVDKWLDPITEGVERAREKLSEDE